MRSQGQLRLGGMGGVAGFDIAAVLTLGKALGIDERIAAELLPFAEAGLVMALNKKEDD